MNIINFEVSTSDVAHAFSVCDLAYGFSGEDWEGVKTSNSIDTLSEYLKSQDVDHQILVMGEHVEVIANPMRTYLITAECSQGNLYVKCRERQIKPYLKMSGFGCQECVDYQEIEGLPDDEVDYLISEAGHIWSRLLFLPEDERDE